MRVRYAFEGHLNRSKNKSRRVYTLEVFLSDGCSNSLAHFPKVASIALLMISLWLRLINSYRFTFASHSSRLMLRKSALPENADTSSELELPASDVYVGSDSGGRVDGRVLTYSSSACGAMNIKELDWMRDAIATTNFDPQSIRWMTRK